jgi:hypothetical protein
MDVRQHMVVRHPSGEVDGSDWHWSPERPYEIAVTFDVGNTWVFARSILTDALNGEHGGIADVRMWLAGRDTFLKLQARETIFSDEASALLIMRTAELRRFHAATARIVKPSAETVVITDAALNAWLAGAE